MRYLSGIGLKNFRVFRYPTHIEIIKNTSKDCDYFKIIDIWA